MTWALDTAAVCAVLGAVAGLGVPALIARIPEPHPAPAPDPSTPSAALTAPARDERDPGLEASPAVAVQHPAPVAPDSPAARAAPAAPATPAMRGPKLPYAEIAASPGLAWKAAVASAVAGGLVALAVGWQWTLAPLLALLPVGVALAVVDWRTRLLPTRVVLPTYAVVGGLALVAGGVAGDWSDLVRGLWGLVLARGFFWLLWRVYPRGMGFGDVRLAGVLGFALGLLGWGHLALGVYAGFVLGGVGGLVLAALRVVDRGAYPFGPFMLVGALAGVLGGGMLTEYYLGRY